MQIYKGLITLVLILILQFANSASAGLLIDFEDLEWRRYYAGDSFTTSGTTVNVERIWNGSTWKNGTAGIIPGNLTGGTGNALYMNYVNASFLLSADYEGLTLKYSGGVFLNIEVNGDLRSFNIFRDIDGTTVGGALVTVNDGYHPLAKNLIITGKITSFKIGGSEFAIDDIQFIPEPATVLLVGLGGAFFAGREEILRGEEN